MHVVTRKLDLGHTSEHVHTDRHKYDKNSLFVTNYGFIYYISPCSGDSGDLCGPKWRIKKLMSKEFSSQAASWNYEQQNKVDLMKRIPVVCWNMRTTIRTLKP